MSIFKKKSIINRLQRITIINSSLILFLIISIISSIEFIQHHQKILLEQIKEKRNFDVLNSLVSSATNETLELVTLNQSKNNILKLLKKNKEIKFTFGQIKSSIKKQSRVHVDSIHKIEPIISSLSSEILTIINLYKKDLKSAATNYYKSRIPSRLSQIYRFTDSEIKILDGHIVEKKEQVSFYLTFSFIVLCFIGAFSLLLIFLLNRQITRSIYLPMNQLIDGMKKLGEGDYFNRVTITTDDEIGKLGTTLNNMSLKIMDAEMENKMHQEDLTIKSKEADTANKAKTNFLANMSHELRTPLHAIMGFTKMSLKNLGNDTNKVELYLQNVMESGTRLTSLLNDLLDLAKLESGKLKPNLSSHDLKTIANQCITSLKPLSDSKKLTVALEAKDNMNGFFDQKLIYQVITNFLSNAIKFSQDNSVIYIHLLTVKKSINGQSKKMLELIIEDNGVGIPKSELESVFDKFIQSSITQKTSGGTGLGLPICKEIIKTHKGHIWAESPLKGNKSGSAFHFIIPAVQ